MIFERYEGEFAQRIYEAKYNARAKLRHVRVLALELWVTVLEAIEDWHFDRLHPTRHFESTPLFDRLIDAEAELEALHKRRLARRQWVRPSPYGPPIKSEPAELSGAALELGKSLRVGDSVKIANGNVHTVLEYPTSASPDGWQLVKITPTREPRPGSSDPKFLLVSLSQIVSRLS